MFFYTIRALEIKNIIGAAAAGDKEEVVKSHADVTMANLSQIFFAIFS